MTSVYRFFFPDEFSASPNHLDNNTTFRTFPRIFTLDAPLGAQTEWPNRDRLRTNEPPGRRGGRHISEYSVKYSKVRHSQMESLMNSTPERAGHEKCTRVGREIAHVSWQVEEFRVKSFIFAIKDRWKFEIFNGFCVGCLVVFFRGE